MKTPALHFGAAAATAIAACLAGGLVGEATSYEGFDLTFLLSTFATERAAIAIAGALLGAVASLLLGDEASPLSERAFTRLLIATQPAVLYGVLTVGAASPLAAAAAFAVWRPAFLLARRSDYRLVLGLALALAGALLVSNGVALFYPALLVCAVFLTPWGLAPRRLAGAASILLIPLGLVLVCAFFLCWLFGYAAAPPVLAAPAFTLLGFTPFLAAPGPVLALARPWRMDAFRAGGAFTISGALAVWLAGEAPLYPLLAAFAGAQLAWGGGRAARFHVCAGWLGAFAAIALPLEEVAARVASLALTP